MFNLEQAIAEWRRQMRAAGIKTPVPMEELENHLREDIETQMHSGFSAESAFTLAVGRIGDVTRLRDEFEKAADPLKARKRKRARKLLLAEALFFGLVLVPAVFAYSSITFRQRGIDVTVGDWLMVFGTIIPMFLSILLGRWIARFLPVIVSERLRLVAAMSVIVAGAMVVRWIWSGLWVNSLVHMEIAVFWTWTPSVGFVWCAIDWEEKCEAARWQSRAIAA
jgi:hypothetical protein